MQEINGVLYIDGLSSDPRKLGWMSGTPAPPDKRITFEGDKFLDFPQIRWSLSHMRELAATANVWRGNGGPSQFLREDRSDEIDALTFVCQDGRARTFADALTDTYTDGILILNRGRIIYERYLGALEAHVPHACHSITKSYAGTLASSLVFNGVLDDRKTVRFYLPEVEGSAWEDATLRQVMDMETGLNYSEEYTDKNASIWAYARSCGWRPKPKGFEGPQTLCDYLTAITKTGEHGKEFAYKTVNTDMMTWVMERVTGHSFVQLLQEMLWEPLGCDEDAYVIIDPAGTAMAGAGLSATLRDLARFGELMRCEGAWEGKQIIPAAVVHDVQKYNDPSKFSSDFTYRSMWWVSRDELGGFLAAGIHGQRLYVLPDSETVIARFASHPVASGTASEPILGPQILALQHFLQE